LSRFFPILAWLPELRKRGVARADLLAGLTGAIVVLPQGIAFATLAGMPPQYGLYGAMVPCIVAAIFGASRLMITGPANAISLTILAMVSPLADAGSARYVELVITLSLMVGLWQFLLGLTRAGKLVDYVSHTVIVGFTTGAAILIINSQLGHFFGVNIARGLGVVQTVQTLIEKIGEVDIFTTSTALITLIAAIAWKPLNRWIPAMLAAVVVGAFYVVAMRWIDPMLTTKTVEALPGALPPLSVPDVQFDTLRLLLIPSIAMTLLALAEAVSIAQALAKRNQEKLDGSQEFIGQGLANIAGSFFSSYPSSGSFNRSGLNVASGAHTPFAAMAASLFLILILLFVAPLAQYLPIASVAAILFLVAWGLIDHREIAHLLKDAYERITLIVTFVATLTLPLEWAVLLGVVISLIVKQIQKKAKSSN
jgi:sulfate permease, SulP family